MTYDKEKAKTSLGELALSLQTRINSKAGNTSLIATTNLIKTIYSRNGYLVTTVGGNRPSTPVANLALNLDTTHQVYEAFGPAGWIRQRLVYSD